MPTYNSNVDSPRVLATIGEPQKSLDAIMRESSCLQKVGNVVSYRQRQLVEEKATIIQSNTSRRQFSSAVWRLPTEILSEIFLYCLPEDRYLSPIPRLAPILLTTICRRWREVAVGFPMLWCRLQMQAEHNDWQQRAFCYSLWLERSGGHLLSLRLECYTNWSKLQSLLRPYIQQISFLELEFSTCNGPFMMEDFHALKGLTIHQDAIERSLSKLPVNLRTLDMTDLLLSRKQLDFFTDCVWAHLTHIEVNITELDAFPRILRLCPDLSSIMMMGIFDPIQTPESIIHPNLQSLHIFGDVFWSSGGELGLFKVVTLPNLRVIEARHMGSWPHEEFKAFLTRSKCPLERLAFGSGVSSTEQQREEYLTLLPSLQLIADTDSNFDVHKFLEDLATLDYATY
ncbi:uncharacterized protein EDB93DRAFT_1168991 [Suillus bovinus]|uniref:uncharacterized protein n=1 Tax=Suillus bovinus TaxID=48563 RepID=UPI001B870532|nr:uncharacterized protein EDB93DRAFT_1168991 [Suillus bovinus]KAG2136517.1 hypothetical protein EDB93DRAFT_1168991 [Suillus bovinus]